jgi:REP element-mobilizing transposase RayT
MPRVPRSQLPEIGFFHVTSRGVGGIFIFLDDVDREAFRVLLMQVVGMFGWRLHAWCLMGTHYHLLIEAPRGQLSAGMHRLNGLYAQRFNRRHGRKGHLYEERFSSWVVDEERHFRAAVSYIVENPLRAGLCADPRDWFWSWPRYPQPVTALSTGPLAAASEGLSLGRGWSRRRQDDVDLARAVHADDELLLDVGAPARPGDDREGAWQLAAERLEELGEPGQDPVLGQQRDMHGRQERPRPRLPRRRREHDAARVGQPV